MAVHEYEHWPGADTNGEYFAARGDELGSSRDELLRKVYEDSPICVELYDSSGRLVDVTPACLGLFGVSRLEDVQGFELFDDPNVSNDAKERLRRGETVRYEAAFDFEKVRSGGLYPTTKR